MPTVASINKLTKTTMKTSINKLVSKEIDNFLVASNTGNIIDRVEKMSDGTTYTVRETNLFAHLDDTKRVIAYLRSCGLDPFKRGTKEPASIAKRLALASWDSMKDIDPATSGARSMWD